MDIYEMFKNGMTADEIKAEVDKTAALYKEDQEAEREEEMNYAKEDLYDAMINFLDTSGEVDPKTLESENFQKMLREIIDDFRDELKFYSKLTKAFKNEKPKNAATPDDLKVLAKLFF